MSLINKLIWQIEIRLHEPVQLEGLADLCAVSPYHMATGRGVVELWIPVNTP